MINCPSFSSSVYGNLLFVYGSLVKLLKIHVNIEKVINYTIRLNLHACVTISLNGLKPSLFKM